MQNIKQVQKVISLETALKILDDEVGGYTKSGLTLQFNKSVPELVQELFDASNKEELTIEYNKASRILEGCKSTKLYPRSNRMIDNIKQRWKSNYLN